MEIKSWVDIPELENALKQLKNVSNECQNKGVGEIVMPYLRRIPKNRNENLAKGRKLFQKEMGYNVS